MASKDPSPTPDEIITEELNAARARIAKRLGVKVAWSTPGIASTENAVRFDVATALRPAMPDLPPRPGREKPPVTSPPAKTLEQKRQEEQRWNSTAAELAEAVREGL